jgi:glycosyltransferase involved in cell wall biosynthesis
MSRILVLATADLRPDQLADSGHLRYPRVDYVELRRHLDIDVFDYALYQQTRLGSFFRRLETQLRSDLYLTLLGLWAAPRYDLVFAMSERAGIPFSALRRLLPGQPPFVSMFQCWSGRQETVVKKLNLLKAMNGVAVHCRTMKNHLLQLGAPAERTHILPYSIDHHFFSPQKAARRPNLVLRVGEIRSRDYPTLFQAVSGLPLDLVVAASGSWYAREKTARLQASVPQNVVVTERMPIIELRSLYARSSFVVLPIYDSIFSAGLTSILEAAAMARPVIAARSRGIAEFVRDGETGILVNPGDALAMRAAIEYLLAHPEEACRMGHNARQRLEEEQNLDIYVEQIAHFLHSCSSRQPTVGGESLARSPRLRS